MARSLPPAHHRPHHPRHPRFSGAFPGDLLGLCRASLRALPWDPLRRPPSRPGPGDRPAVRRHQPRRAGGPPRGGPPERGADRPAAARSHRPDVRPVRHGRGPVPHVAPREPAGRRRRALVHGVPDGGPRRGRRGAPHHRRHRGHGAEPARRGRHPPPRVHDPEGQERPPRPAAVDRRQPVAGVGPLARRRAHRAARVRRPSPRPLRGRRRGAHGVADLRPGPGRGHRRRHQRRAHRDRRRPPPLRDLARLPRRAPGRLAPTAPPAGPRP